MTKEREQSSSCCGFLGKCCSGTYAYDQKLLSAFKWVYSAGMYVKVTRSGPRRYVQLVESFRNEEGKVKQRTLATLGRLELLLA